MFLFRFLSFSDRQMNLFDPFQVYLSLTLYERDLVFFLTYRTTSNSQIYKLGEFPTLIWYEDELGVQQINQRDQWLLFKYIRDIKVNQSVFILPNNNVYRPMGHLVIHINTIALRNFTLRNLRRKFLPFYKLNQRREYILLLNFIKEGIRKQIIIKKGKHPIHNSSVH